MAHAQFHKNQKVYVKPVGTWALVERVVPHWTKGLDEPIRVYYDVGLGRDFGADELQSDSTLSVGGEGEEQWRVVRSPNKWQSATETMNHPYPGTYPSIITGEAEWGGWRVPGAEYALSPTRIERQARMIACTPRLVAVVEQLTKWSQKAPRDVQESLKEVLAKANEALAYLKEGAD
jgi:hypothetical protein